MATEIKIEDSNMAMFGGKEHKDWAFDKASLEKNYKGAGDKGPGIQIWRVKNMKRTDTSGPKFGIVKVDEKEHGTFYSGDSYIVLETYMKESKKCFNLFFWLGRESSQDEIGVAAYKAVELDDLLGDAPVQYRELDGFESSHFLKLFKKSLNILKGGFESGFTKVKPEEYKPRLLHLKGAKKSTIVVREVDCKRDSLNEGDSFILDAGAAVYVFNGKSAGIWEKTRATQVSNGIIGGPGRGKSKREYVTSEEKGVESFWKALGGYGSVPAEIPDEKKDTKSSGPSCNDLWKLSDSTGSLKLTKVSSTPTKSAVTSDDVFLLNRGNELLVYVGSKVSVQERYGAIGVGINFLKLNKMSDRTPISKCIEGKNDEEFLSLLK
uniref:Gelsolin-like domain-containing protein n=1 Tax=Amorphochlora amoebiformis TaxID=1561963 RepID=A0A6T6X7U1_9EUKA|mmetsp:Transcript_32442/g.52280  ORF Transcript_32442/g.52280 Transcript_32442/m.52280 type:complete len:379 (+) Transcript_32442:48-1184(+)